MNGFFEHTWFNNNLKFDFRGVSWLHRLEIDKFVYPPFILHVNARILELNFKFFSIWTYFKQGYICFGPEVSKKTPNFLSSGHCVMRGSIGEELSERARTNNVIQHTFWWLVTNAPPSSTGNAHYWLSGIHSNS